VIVDSPDEHAPAESVDGWRRLGDNSANTREIGSPSHEDSPTIDLVDTRHCNHRTACPAADAPDAAAARVVADCQQQGWSLLCNGLVTFDDLADLCPDGTVRPATRLAPSPIA